MPQPPERKPQRPEDIVNIVYGLATIYNGAFTPILRSGFGSKAFASYPITLIFMVVASAYLRCPQLITYIPVWLVLVVLRRITADRTQHSRYQGYPWLMRLIPFVRNEFQGRLLEPGIIFFTGVFLAPSSLPLARFVIGGSLSLFIVLGTEMEVMCARKRAMHDARVDARRMADLERGGDGWN